MDRLVLAHLEQTNPEFYEFWSNVDDEGLLLRAKKLRDGFTFLMPVGDYCSEVCDMDDEEDAVDEFRRMILPIFLASPSDWNANKDTIANLHDKYIDVDNIHGRKITLKDGATIEQDRSFNRNGMNVAIYRVTSGRLPKGTRKVARRSNRTKMTVAKK